MKRKILLLVFAVLVTVNSVYAQKLITKTGTIKFEASLPSFEDVAAENKSASAVLETTTGNIAVLALMKGFRFKVALMEEHFNENYVESDKYPKAVFKGKVEKFDISKVTTEAKTYVITGDITLHGKTKQVSAPAKIYKAGNTVIVIGNFDVKPADFDIEIPGLVKQKISDKIKINYNFALSN